MVELEVRGSTGIVRLNRVPRRNALHAPMWSALAEHAASLASTPELRAVVVHGAGEHFCAGMDLKPDNPLVQRLMPLVLGEDADGLRALVEELKGCLFGFAELPVPVICAIEGSCLGAGLELALTADLRVAGRSATFSLPETRWGMVPDVGGTVRLSRLVGRSRAGRLALLGETIQADTAHAWGLADELVDDGTALEVALAWSDRIARMAPTATRETLGLLRSHPGDDRFGAETEAGVRALLSGEVLEGVTSFAERRDARW